MPEVDLVSIEALQRAFLEGAAEALRQDVAEPILEEARTLAPMSPAPYKWYHPEGSEVGPLGGRYDWVLPGRLRASGRIRPEGGPAILGDSMYEEIVFGNEEVKYAAIQHEELSYHHTHGQAKYLESPVLGAKAWMAEAIAKRVEEKLVETCANPSNRKVKI